MHFEGIQNMKLAIKLSEFDPVAVPYETKGITAFPEKQSADGMCKRINDDPSFGSYHWLVEELERNGKSYWVIVSGVDERERNTVRS
jgi:hypothetical protein